MTKQEFIEKLRAALTGKISPALVAENIAYYEDYINTEIRKGKTEAEVLASLGNPRLIARSIIDANGGASQGETANVRMQSNQDYEEYGDSTDRVRKRVVKIPAWLGFILVILVIVFVLGLVFSALSYLLPIVMPILLVFFLIKLFRDWLH